MADGKTILLLGANMYLGVLIRNFLSGTSYRLRLADCAPIDSGTDSVESLVGNLSDRSFLVSCCRGADVVIDLSKLDVERWNHGDLAPYTAGVANLWEAARIAGVKRVITLSSDGVVGFYRRATVVDHLSLPRPDGPSGVVGALSESMASLYAYKFGIRALCIRMGSCRPQPVDERMLSTWISPADFERLIDMALVADYSFEIVYGVSANVDRWWDNANAGRLGFKAEDRSDVFAAELRGQRSGNMIENVFQGGPGAASEFRGDPRRIP